MHEPFPSIFSAVAIFAGLYLVHEVGHYVAGAVAGIPADARRFVVLAVPPHVALADGGRWVSPFENDRFSIAYGRYDPDRRYSVLFTAGGLLAQTVAAVAVGVAAGPYLPVFARGVVVVSLWFLAGHIVVDLVRTAWRGRPTHDVTHLWRLDPLAAVAMLTAVVGAHVGALLWLA